MVVGSFHGEGIHHLTKKIDSSQTKNSSYLGHEKPPKFFIFFWKFFRLGFGHFKNVGQFIVYYKSLILCY